MTAALIDDFDYKLKIQDAKTEYWEWACKNIPRGTWLVRTGFTGNSETFYFEYEEDLLAFRLANGI